MFSTLLHAFAHQIQTRSNETAIIVNVDSETQAYTWLELSQHVCIQADELSRLLNARPDLARYVGYASDNSLGDVLMAIACPLIGAIEIPVDHRLSSQAKELAQSIGGLWIEKHGIDEQNLTSKIDAGDQLRRIQRDLQKLNRNSVAIVLWTSGTTTTPKAVKLTHRHLVDNAQAKLAAVPNGPDDVRLTSLPLCHAYARTCDLGTWLLSGCTLAIGLGFEVWQTLGPHVRPTLANVVPSLANRLFKSDVAKVGIDRMRLLGCGGAAMTPADFASWKARGVTVIQGYGLTETSPVICSATPENATAGLVGEFVNGWEHEIRDGRLFVRGSHVMAGYWNDVEATNQRISGGWLDTGDLVELDSATSQLRIIGRADEVIVLDNGHKVHPQSIERQIERVEGVRHALIVGAGRTIELWLDANPSDDLIESIRSRLGPLPKWEQPTAYHFFSRPLTHAAGDLNSKGTIRRKSVTKHAK